MEGCDDLALPLVVFFFFVLVAVILFAIGVTRFSLGAGFAFTSLAGVFFILVGLLLWTTGLQLDYTQSFDTSTETINVTYQTLSFGINPEITMMAYFFTFGGFFPIIFAIKNVLAVRRQAKEHVEQFEWSV